jgi:hypothetical protein
LFIPKGKGTARINDAGQTIDVYDDDEEVTSVRAILKVIDKTVQNVFKAAIRPDVDIIAYVAHDVTLERGWKVEWNDTQYEVAEIESQLSDMKRVLLREQARGGLDLDA